MDSRPALSAPLPPLDSLMAGLIENEDVHTKFAGHSSRWIHARFPLGLIGLRERANERHAPFHWFVCALIYFYLYFSLSSLFPFFRCHLFSIESLHKTQISVHPSHSFPRTPHRHTRHPLPRRPQPGISLKHIPQEYTASLRSKHFLQVFVFYYVSQGRRGCGDSYAVLHIRH